MSIEFNKLAAAMALSCVLPMASATVLTFENLSGTDFFLGTYQGFNFGDNSIVTNPWFYTDQIVPFANYTPKSGTHYVSTDYTLYDINDTFHATQPITSATPFKFDGAWFSGYNQIYYKLYNGAALVYTSASSAMLSATPLFVASGYAPLVTGVVIYGAQGFYAMDDFTYTAAAVPEPSTYALMVGGLLGVGFIARRRQQRQS